jgi:hypothetical protein
MAAIGHAVAGWFEDGSRDLADHLARAFDDTRDLSAKSREAGRGAPPTPGKD